MVGYSKATIETFFKSVAVTQEQNKKIAGEAIEKAAYIPEEGKVVVQKWLNVSKEAGETFRESVLKGHEQIEKYFNAA